MMVTGSVMKYLQVGPLLGADLSPVIMASSPWMPISAGPKKCEFGGCDYRMNHGLI